MYAMGKLATGQWWRRSLGVVKNRVTLSPHSGRLSGCPFLPVIANMSPALSAACLSPDSRQAIGIQALARSQPVSRIAATHQVSRKFVYQQGDKARRSLDESFAPTPADDEVLFHLPVTKSWLYQLILGLVLICHSS